MAEQSVSERAREAVRQAITKAAPIPNAGVVQNRT
jgi:hypothetical protein